MSTLIIDAEKCKQDGICADVCPTKFIKGSVGVLPAGRDGRGMCIACGQCMAFCPHEAIKVARFANEPVLRFDKKDLPSPESVEILCKTRRSIRVFKEKAVPTNLVQSLIASASYAPTAKNQRFLRQIVLHDTKRLNEFGELLVNCLEHNLQDNTQNLALDEAKSLVRGWRAGKDPILRHAPHLILTVVPVSWAWRAVDASIFLSYFEILAHTHGVGACWAGYVTKATKAFPELRQFLGLKEDEEVCGGQLFGYSKYKVQAIPPRPAYEHVWL